jgi:hypothetical protein
MRRNLALPLLALALAACSDQAPTGPGAEFLTCGFHSAAAMAVGEVRTLTGSEAGLLCLSAAASASADYTVVPFYASATDEALLSFSVLGANAHAPEGPPSPDVVPSFSRLGQAARPRRVADPAFHLRMMERTRRQIQPLLHGGGGGANLSRVPAVPVKPMALKAVGDTMRINTSGYCDQTDYRVGRVAAVSQRAIVLTDVANPAGGFSDAEYRSFAATFDTLVYDNDVKYFGAPSDIDADGGRQVIFFTRAVNELTPPGSSGFVGGYFSVLDLLPRTAAERLRSDVPLCAGSNHGEMFYMLVPDPFGAVNGNVFTREDVLSNTLGTLGHEFQHLINASRRLYVARGDYLEDIWLDEGLAHAAEELLFYRASGLSPRQNVSLNTILSSERILEAANTYAVANLVRYGLYLIKPDSNSLLGQDFLETRGATWSFLRYSIDRKGGPDQPFFYSLVNSPTYGVDNLRNVIGDDPIDWMQDWTVSVYADDAVAVDARYTQPSWNFRTIVPVFELDGSKHFPLKVYDLASGHETSLELQAGGAGFIRFGLDADAHVALQTLSDGAPAPDKLRLSILRTR